MKKIEGMKFNIQNILTILLLMITPLVKGQSYFNMTADQTDNGDYIYHFTPDEATLLANYPLESSEGSYTYFWNFGDGQYSFKKTPSHLYSASDDVTVEMLATPIYSPTTPPPSFNSSFTVQGNDISNYNEDPMLLLVRKPRPEHSSLSIINYENTTTETITDAAVRFYFHTKYFEHLSTQTFNNENETLVFDNSLSPKYNAYLEYEVGELLPAEQHTIFVDLLASEDIMGAVGNPLPKLFLRAELLDKRVNDIILVNDYEMVTKGGGSWDPNSKFTSTDLLFLDNLQANTAEVVYEINFQNMGIGLAKDVVIEDYLPNEFDLSTVQILEYYHPEIETYDGFSYTIDLATGLLECTFQNINLAGMNQMNLSDPEKTKGYVTFKINTKSGLAAPVSSPFRPTVTTQIDSCLPYDSIVNQAFIKFDSNPPIVTNQTVSHLYYSESVACLTSPTYTLIPNPIINGVIKIEACNIPFIFMNNLTFQLYEMTTGQLVNCNLNPTFQINSSSNFCNDILLTPPCITPGLYQLRILYNNQPSHLSVVVN